MFRTNWWNKMCAQVANAQRCKRGGVDGTLASGCNGQMGAVSGSSWKLKREKMKQWGGTHEWQFFESRLQSFLCVAKVAAVVQVVSRIFCTLPSCLTPHCLSITSMMNFPFPPYWSQLPRWYHGWAWILRWTWQTSTCFKWRFVNQNSSDANNFFTLPAKLISKNHNRFVVPELLHIVCSCDRIVHISPQLARTFLLSPMATESTRSCTRTLLHTHALLLFCLHLTHCLSFPSYFGFFSLLPLLPVFPLLPFLQHFDFPLLLIIVGTFATFVGSALALFVCRLGTVPLSSILNNWKVWERREQKEGGEREEEKRRKKRGEREKRRGEEEAREREASKEKCRLTAVVWSNEEPW